MARWLGWHKSEGRARLFWIASNGGGKKGAAKKKGAASKNLPGGQPGDCFRGPIAFREMQGGAGVWFTGGRVMDAAPPPPGRGRLGDKPRNIRDFLLSAPTNHSSAGGAQGLPPRPPTTAGFQSLWRGEVNFFRTTPNRALKILPHHPPSYFQKGGTIALAGRLDETPRTQNVFVKPSKKGELFICHQKESVPLGRKFVMAFSVGGGGLPKGPHFGAQVVGKWGGTSSGVETWGAHCTLGNHKTTMRGGTSGGGGTIAPGPRFGPRGSGPQGVQPPQGKKKHEFIGWMGRALGPILRGDLAWNWGWPSDWKRLRER